MSRTFFQAFLEKSARPWLLFLERRVDNAVDPLLSKPESMLQVLIPGCVWRARSLARSLDLEWFSQFKETAAAVAC